MKRVLVLFLAIFLVGFVLADCSTPKIDSASQFFSNFSSYQQAIKSCPVQLPAAIVKFYSSGNFQVNIGNETFYIVISAGQISDMTRDKQSVKYSVSMSYTDFDNLLKSTDKSTYGMFLYKQGKITIKAVGFFNNIKWFFLKPFLWFFTKDVNVQLKNVGEVCNHGGECKTGNCVGVGQGPPWTYECSCDPFKFDTTSCKN